MAVAGQVGVGRHPSSMLLQEAGEHGVPVLVHKVGLVQGDVQLPELQCITSSSLPLGCLTTRQLPSCGREGGVHNPLKALPHTAELQQTKPHLQTCCASRRSCSTEQFWLPSSSDSSQLRMNTPNSSCLQGKGLQ